MSSTENEELSISSDENMEQINNLELKGKILKHYNILYELGRGAFSIVWLAYNINNNNYYALKVQTPEEYKVGIDEIKFVNKLPENPNVFNNIYESFIEIQNNLKYLCSVWHLHASNIDNLLRKGKYTNGFPLHIVKIIMKQLIESISILHTRFKVFHGDIKTDNILIKGLNNKDKFMIDEYNNAKFLDQYIEKKKNIINKETKKKLREDIHLTITNEILEKYEKTDIETRKYDINIDNINISLADFGTYCTEDNYYDEPFGTRYYQAPEIILGGKCSYPVDIWALGCTFYELLTGKLLFDPNKDLNYSRDYYHLYLINKTCGNYNSIFLKTTQNYKKYFDKEYKLKDFDNEDMTRLTDKINEIDNITSDDKKDIHTILIKMLSINPNIRVLIKDLI